jgi:hypothetical protein
VNQEPINWLLTTNLGTFIHHLLSFFCLSTH